ncbi:MAG TPA: hypothetical protein VF288_10680 [Mycobacteriales bacterium]
MTVEGRLRVVSGLRLGAGAHAAPDGAPDGARLCVMEAVAYVAGEPWSDRPACASSVVSAFMRPWNDAMADDERQSLRRYIARLVGSRGTDEQEMQRSWMALDWLVRVYAPAWLDAAGLGDHADGLRSLRRISSGRRVAEAAPVVVAARTAARAAARTAAGPAAGAAAGPAAWDAAAAAAWAADWATAGAADWATARAAAGAAAAWATSEDALAPTVAALQASAHDLIDRMLRVTEEGS